MKITLATIPVLMTAVFVCPYLRTHAQGCSSTAGANNATSFSTAAYAGSGFTWSNPGNAQASDGSYAQAGINLAAFSSAYSDYLTIQNFGFSIPSTATICEIRVEVERSVSGLGLGGMVADKSIRLLKNGTLYGNDLANPAVAWPASDGTVTYGNGLLAGTWGGSWLPSDVNSANFGVSISTLLNTGILGLFMRGRIDQVQVTVIYDPNSILPVGLESFTASRSPSGDGHLLTWTDAGGVTNSKYIIQRSGDSRHWQDIATVATAGSHSTLQPLPYMYTDHSPLDGANFYRLRMESTDGRSLYSTVKEVEGVKTSVRCWPNPFTDLIHLSGLSPIKRVVLKDIQGRVIYTKDAAEATRDWQIPATALPPGLYFVQAGTETFRVLKQAK